VHNQPFAPHGWDLDQTRFTPLGAESPQMTLSLHPAH
jgi:hypothetical protein